MAKASELQRPDLTSDSVIVRAVLLVEDQLSDWVTKRVMQKVPKEAAVALVTVAIKETGADGFRAASRLMESAGWPADFDLCVVIQRACDQLPYCRRLVLSEWVIKHKVRFPAAVGDGVEWKSQGKTRTGIVHTVIAREAAAIVRPTIGSALSGELVKIVCEQVLPKEAKGHA